MSIATRIVHETPEEYKQGWVHGFYDARPDDGAFYGKSTDDNHRSPCSQESADSVRLYWEGYRAGRIARLNGNPC
jgi:hypothetical protein